MSVHAPSSAYDSETFNQSASFHIDSPIGSMTISPSGRDVALASKEGLHIIDLDSPYSPPRYLPHRTPWEVADVQWSPHASRDYWVVSTSNQKALVWNLDAKSWQDSIQLVLHGHRRAITDINFSAHNPDILATCAVDSFVHCWDLRTPGRPAVSFSDWFAAATQVKWSRQDEHVVASSHDKFLHIWDDRHGAVPVRTIEAHNTKIYGIDWNRFHHNKIVTCGLDRTIKFWDCDNPVDEPDRVIETPYPVWRARHTPFGWGLVAMPERGSGDLYLYDRRAVQGHVESGQVKPVTKFPGHNGQVKEFLWRSRGNVLNGVDHREFQLISWGTDRELRLHRIEPETVEGIGYEKGVSKTENLNFTRRGARYRSFRDSPDDTNSPIERPSRGESLPSQYQLNAFRKRNSTTVGMSKVPMSQIKGWVSGPRRSSKIAMHGKSSTTNNINPISWLKNVKIASWDPDALAEEIRHVGEKFRRVEFETVDIKHRKMVMSLQAPWAEHQNAIYLRVDIRFPQTYPRGANAVITIQKTGALADELHHTLSGELHTIAKAYASQQRGCLEAILRYLLREQSLEQIVSWVRGDSLADSKILGGDLQATDDDSSSSDDDQLEGLGNALDSTANIRVPLAKGCGAVWSETGKLICFFPPKSKVPTSTLTGLSANSLERSENSRLYEGFGKLHVNSPLRKSTGGTKATDDDESGSESSDSLLSSSSSSSSSSEPGTDIQGDYGPLKRGMLAFAPGPRSFDFSNRSTTLAGAKTAATDTQRHTIVSIRSFDELIPSKKELARRYKVFGPGSEVCKQNAAVAGSLGRSDLVSVWTLASMVLDKSVPLHRLTETLDGSETDFLVIARKTTSKLQRKHDGMGMSDEQSNDHKGQLRWGGSPLASRYLVPAMFDYFERIADIQMLAMLACVFWDSTSAAPLPAQPLENHDYFPSLEVANAMLWPTPMFDDYNMAVTGQRPQISRLLSSHSERGAHRSRRETAMSLDPSTASYRPEWSRAPSVIADELDRRSTAVSLSTSPEGGRAIQRAATSGGLSTAQASLSALTQSYSHSPPSQPSSGGVASSLKKYSPSGSLAQNWGLFGGSHSSRPSRTSVHYPESSSQDKDASLRSSMSHSNLRALRRSGHTTPEATRRTLRSVAPSEGSDTTRRADMKGKKRVVKTFLRNQHSFDLDSYVSLPLLDPALDWKYRSFRAAYATLLEAWDLPVQRAEVLKIDGFHESSIETDVASPAKRSPRKSQLPSPGGDEQGLRVGRCCQRCGDVLAAIEKNGVVIGWSCISAGCNAAPRKPSKRSFCSTCWKPVQGLAVPCVECGHLTCVSCARTWFGTKPAHQKRRQSSLAVTDGDSVSDIRTGAHRPSEASASTNESPRSRTCPAGCGCPCPTLAPSAIHVPTPAGSLSAAASAVPSTPASAVSEKFLHVHPKMERTDSQTSAHSVGSSQTTATAGGGADGALNAFFALTGVRSRAGSKAERGGGRNGSGTGNGGGGSGRQRGIRGKGRVMTGPITVDDVGAGQAAGEEAVSKDVEVERQLNPWVNGRFQSLGKGVGGGLSRGLRERGSDSTIRGGK
ncbi:uncharacterized protein HMPREF1541_04735 [Cyphellophora europaea CBS 101466]|uniref:Uncharacterized protein n=1 Tax=Cyphellophora europaea (strain CBS 101466) TaxID=1220924 RepID=W2RXG6_CYPE1|nr:uncharacterized protein HMPREF1541_04735 [Cyphellophora europaea CBS 101466]ETN40458.1 hypothetical protein HMPREF1541_04735 [Cyphellophora europaea CBS 101466]